MIKLWPGLRCLSAVESHPSPSLLVPGYSGNKESHAHLPSVQLHKTSTEVVGFSWRLGKEPACNAGDPCSIPESGRSLGEGNGYPLQYFCLENSIGEEPGGPQSMGSQRVGHD